MKRVFSPLVGVTTRDLVFSDAYSRRLPQDTKGVMVAGEERLTGIAGHHPALGRHS